MAFQLYSLKVEGKNLYNAVFKAPFAACVDTETNIHLWNLTGDEPIHYILEGHTFYIDRIILGSNVLVSSALNIIKIWRLSDGVCLNTLNSSPMSRIYDIVLNEEQGIIAGGGSGDIVWIWRIEDGVCLHSLSGHSGCIFCIAIGNGVIVSGGYDKTIKIWNLSDGSLIRTLVGHPDTICSLSIGDGFIASGDGLGTIKIWRLLDGELLHTLRRHSDSIVRIVFTPKYMLSYGSNCLVIRWRLTDWKIIQSLVLTAIRNWYGDFSSEFIIGNKDKRDSIEIWQFTDIKRYEILRWAHSTGRIRRTIRDK